MILYDTGYLVAVLVRTDQFHRQAVETLKRETSALITTLPCVTEAMYLTMAHGGRGALDGLIRQIKGGLFAVHELTQSDVIRACDLMQQYADAPMDFADGSLVVAAERLGITKILTFDRHFHAYRIHGSTPFDVVS